jgi:hypothetical protein
LDNGAGRHCGVPPYAATIKRGAADRAGLRPDPSALTRAQAMETLLAYVLAQATQGSQFPPASGYVIGWGTLSLINAGLAQGKNRGGLAWFIASVFLGPIATLCIVILEKRPPTPPAG